MLQETNQHADLPLLVKAEGVLIATDVIWESFFLMLGRNPLLLFMLPVWLKNGSERLATELLTRFPPEAEYLPYHESLLSYLRTQRQTGRRLVLTTTLSVPLARQVANHLGLFDEVISLTADSGLGQAGKQGQEDDSALPAAFVYACCNTEEPLAEGASAIVLLNPMHKRSRSFRTTVEIEKSIVSENAGWATYVRAARMHQWLKNLLIFVPLITAHQIGDLSLVLRAVCAFLSFSLCASAIYLLNDLVDLPADRKHQNKGNRPLANGRLPIKTATQLVPLLILTAFAVGLYPGTLFLTVLTAYLGLTSLYTFWLKKLVIVDVVILALLYTFRILAGGAAVAIMPSFWLLCFAMFIFFSLALMKRSTDLLLGQRIGQNLMEGRGYSNSDAPIVEVFGIVSGYLSVLVLALYINSDDVRLLYSHPELIWLLCPILFFWISRVWLITSRGQMSDDPVLFAIQDRVSQTIAILSAVILWLAT